MAHDDGDDRRGMPHTTSQPDDAAHGNDPTLRSDDPEHPSAREIEDSTVEGEQREAVSNVPDDETTRVTDRVEPGDAGYRSSAHRPAEGVPTGIDPAQRPAEGTTETADAVEGVHQPDEHPQPPSRSHGASGPGSAAAAAGELPVDSVEATQTDHPYPEETWQRPVTGVHRPSAPSGEVAPE